MINTENKKEYEAPEIEITGRISTPFASYYITHKSIFNKEDVNDPDDLFVLYEQKENDIKKLAESDDELELLNIIDSRNETKENTL